MRRIICVCMVLCLCLIFPGCKTTGTQSGYSPTFEKMKAGRWGGGW